jgi:hypothetical protein
VFRVMLDIPASPEVLPAENVQVSSNTGVHITEAADERRRALRQGQR